MQVASNEKGRSPLSSQINLDFTPKRSETSWTDMRVEQIKKKYNTSDKKGKTPQQKFKIKTSNQDKENIKKVIKTQHNEYKHPSKDILNSIDSISHRHMTIDHSNQVRLRSSKAAQTSAKVQNAKNQPKQKISAFQTQDHLNIKSTLNEKLHNQESQNFISPHPSIRLLTEYCSSSKHRQIIATKKSRREVQGYRIQNIEKINSKIKHILDCIRNCEQEELDEIKTSQIDMNRSRDFRQSYLRQSLYTGSDLKREGTSQLQQTKIIQKKKFYYLNEKPAQIGGEESPNERLRSSCYPMRNSRSSNHFEQYLNNYKNRLNDHKLNIAQKKYVGKECSVGRSSSCVYKPRNCDMSLNENLCLDDEKAQQIDKQINRFHKKIQQLQEKKRKMNIQFKPFNFQCSPIKKPYLHNQGLYSKKKNHHELKLQRYSAERQPSHFFTQQLIKQSEEPQEQLQTKNESKALYRFSKDSVYPQRVALQSSNYIKPPKIFSIDSRQLKQSILNESTEPNIEINPKNYDNEELRKKISQRMQQRRRMLEIIQSQINPLSETQETEKFIKTLCRQVCLDQVLRNSKNWFAELHKLGKKDILLEQFIRKGINMTAEQVNEQFAINNEIQNDPFYSFREEQYTIQRVVNSYIESKQFWQMYLSKQWNFQQILNNEHLLKKLNGKQEIAIEDIVRLINTQTGNFYRNRDVYLIYQRIKKAVGGASKQRVSIEELKQVFGKQ